MVLHNDKWAKKAKKAVERRKGTAGSRGRGRGTTVPNALERLDMNRPVEEVAEKSASESGSSDEDSFEFDSGDEGKLLDSRPDKAQVAVATPDAIQQGRRNVKHQENESQHELARGASAPTNGPSSAATSNPDSLLSKPDKRFARRKLVDNSSRYEEPVLDPYLVVAEPEPEIDYHNMTSRQFTNPKDIELVPDEKSSRRTPQLMEDTTHFEKLKQVQQKQEYAREMKRRFGQRSGFIRTKEQPVSATEDDDFFSAIDTENSKVEASSVETDQARARAKHQGDSDENLEHMEKFLDDLLRI